MYTGWREPLLNVSVLGFAVWKYSNWSLNLLTKRITRAKIIRHLTPWRSCGFPCVFKVDCNGTCLKQRDQGHILNIKQFIIMKESITVISSTGEKLSVLRSVRFCVLHYIFEGINHKMPRATISAGPRVASRRARWFFALDREPAYSNFSSKISFTHITKTRSSYH